MWRLALSLAGLEVRLAGREPVRPGGAGVALRPVPGGRCRHVATRAAACRAGSARLAIGLGARPWAGLGFRAGRGGWRAGSPSRGFVLAYGLLPGDAGEFLVDLAGAVPGGG